MYLCNVTKTLAVIQYKQTIKVILYVNINSKSYNMAAISKNEQKWQAESDARTMAEYQQIINDKARMGRAIKVAKTQAADLTKRATAMQNVAKTRTTGRKK